MDNYGWVFAAFFLVTFVACIVLSANVGVGESERSFLVVALTDYGSFLGGIFAAVGTVVGGYLAFAATSTATRENTRLLLRSQNNDRAIELREFIDFYSSYISMIAVQYKIFIEMYDNPITRVWRESVSSVAKLQKDAPKWRLIYPAGIERMLRFVPAGIQSATMMMEQLSPERGTIKPSDFDEEIRKYLAYDQHHVGMRLAEAKSFLLMLNQAATKYRNLEEEFDGFRIPDLPYFEEIADEFWVERASLEARLFRSGDGMSAKYVDPRP